ncbi:WxL protein peptidoglycan domain-containing protein [Actinoplanes philippinensis]|uniref:WxL protein peptidoglycan domain-containing protein n=1 Tax=Actinoplanes philippinensis TaxID=35752 RepID=UPI0034043601
MRTRLAAAALTLATLTIPAPAHAADDALTWSVSPSGPKGPNGRSALDYKLDPGATVTDHVAVTNHSKQPVTLRLYAQDAYTTPGGGFDLRAGNTAPTDAGRWITLDRDRITVPATARIVLPFTLTVPADATPGDHAAGVVASLATEAGDAAGRRVSVDHRVGSRVHLRVTGALRPSLTVTDVRIDTATSWHPLRLPRVTATFTVANTGNVRLTGAPSARVEGPFGLGARAATAPALPEILPGGALTTTVVLDAVPPLFREHLIVDVQPATADGRAIDPAPVRALSEHTVRLTPWPQLALAALAIVLVLGLLLARRRSRRRMRAALAAAEQRGRAEAALATGQPGHGAANGSAQKKGTS